MKLAFRVAAVPNWDFVAAATALKSAGYDGVELFASCDPSIDTVNNVLLTAPDKIRRIAVDAGIKIASVSFASTGESDDLARVIETAAALGTTTVRVERANADASIRGFDAFAAGVSRFADTAAAAGITLLLENEPVPDSVTRLWRAVDGCNHPSVACCWNGQNGRRAGELPLVSIPTLNSRIRMVRTEHPATSDFPLQKILQRLAGIGFSGWVLTESIDEDGARQALAAIKDFLNKLNPARPTAKESVQAARK